MGTTEGCTLEEGSVTLGTEMAGFCRYAKLKPEVFPEKFSYIQNGSRMQDLP